MPRLALLVTSLIAFAACYRDNSKYCNLPRNANEPACMDASIGGPCRSPDDCTPDLPVCDRTLNDGTCVRCTADDHELCRGMTPRCEANTCVGCVDDNDCGGIAGVCLPDGACADPSRIIHAKASGGLDAGTCGALGNECTLSRALLVVTTDKNIIKLDDPADYAFDGFEVDVSVGIPVTIDARGATLRHTNTGPVLTVKEDRIVTILGGTIANARGSNGDGIFCRPRATLTIDGTTFTANEESAIETDSCTLRVKNATINNNSNRLDQYLPAIEAKGGSLTVWLSKLDSNQGGGVRVTNNGRIAIVGNLFQNNGTAGVSDVAGLVITTTADPANRLEFNTIVNNHASVSLAQGVQCNPGEFIARNNIIWNTVTLTDPLITAACKHAYSDIKQALPETNNGGNNLSEDPLFESDFRVRAGSPVDGRADPNAKLDEIAAVDLAGQHRTSPADIGAYQVPVPVSQ